MIVMEGQRTNATVSRENAKARTTRARNELIKVGDDVVTVGAACDRLGCNIQRLRVAMKKRPTWAELERRFRK